MIRIQKELCKVRQRFIEISSTVENTLKKTVQSVLEMDTKLAEEIIENEKIIDKMEVDLEEECLKVLALYQPVATDLRFIIALLKINNDLERIGDLSEHIAKKVLHISKKEKEMVPFPFNFKKMSSVTLSMLKKSIDALLSFNSQEAYEVLELDNKIDLIHKQMFRKVEKLIMESPQKTALMIDIVGISRYMERIADHITNISEDVIYMTDGEIIRHNRN